MLSIEQLTVTAYFADGSILCHTCGEKAGLPAKDAMCSIMSILIDLLKTREYHDHNTTN
jgi:hypothetical protein